MSIKWDEVQTKVVTWGIIAILAGIAAAYHKLERLEAKVQMIEDTILSVWEAQE